MKSQDLLFIGGPSHGQVLSVPRGATQMIDTASASLREVAQHGLYRLRHYTFRPGGRMLHVMVFEGLTDAQVRDFLEQPPPLPQKGATP
jgi:hypothetical protein